MKVERKEKAFEPVVITLETALELYWMTRYVGYVTDTDFDDDLGNKLSFEFWNKLKEYV